jgi:hypothetical protein
MYPFGFSFLFCPAGWPEGKDWLLPGVTLIQVQAQKVNQHQPLVFLPPSPPAFPAGLGADSATAGAAAGSSPPVQEQALQHLLGPALAMMCFKLQLQAGLTAYYEDIKGVQGPSSCPKTKIVKHQVEDNLPVLQVDWA